jgi:hypothetical protein
LTHLITEFKRRFPGLADTRVLDLGGTAISWRVAGLRAQHVTHVQTLYRYFPIEPHWLFPGFQFLPFRARVEITRHWSVGHNPALKDVAEAAALVASTELVSPPKMRAYFPDGEFWFERIVGVPKSLVAVKGA